MAAVVTVTKNTYTVDPLYQWDLNQVLEIRGLSMATVPEVHFTNDATARAVRRFATMDAAGVIRAEVPNGLLQSNLKLRAHICTREGELFKTWYTVEIPVKARKQPADYTITDDQDIYSFTMLEDQVREATEDLAAAVKRVDGAVATANAAKSTAEGIAAIAEDAQATAENAQAAANEAKTAAAAAQNAAAAPVTAYYTATIGTDWQGTEAPFTQTVAVAGLLASDRPRVDLLPSDDFAAVELEIEDYAKIYRITAEAGAIIVYATEATEVALNIQLEASRK